MDANILPQNPGPKKFSSIPLVARVFFIIVLLIILGTFVFLHIQQSRQKQQEVYLLQHGEKISAAITNITQDMGVNVSHNHPYVIYAEWTDPTTGKGYNFSSNYLWQDPTFEFRNITSVTVYVDSTNFSDYYMDLSQYGFN